MPRSPEVTRAVAAVMRHSASGPAPDAVRLAAARRDLVTAKIAEHVERTLAEAPPLKPEQTERIVSLLRSGGLV